MRNYGTADLVQFGRHSGFSDEDTIGAGEKLVKALEETVSAGEVLIALLGRCWLDACGSV